MDELTKVVLLAIRCHERDVRFEEFSVRDESQRGVTMVVPLLPDETIGIHTRNWQMTVRVFSPKLTALELLVV